jgi:uncharacterized protein (UPF0335 family)
MESTARLLSDVISVSVYRSGAMVTRHAMAPAGAIACSVHDLPLVLDDASVRVHCEGASAVDVRVEVALPPSGATLVAADTARLIESERRIERLEERIEDLNQELAQVRSLRFDLPQRLEDEPPRPAPHVAWAEARAFIAETERRCENERLAIMKELRDARETHQRLQRESTRARGNSNTSKVSKTLCFCLSEPVSTQARIIIEYTVRGAKWAPSYVARVSRDGLRATLSVRAMVAQATGETWTNVRLACATAELSRRCDLPELASLRIGRALPHAPPSGFRDPPSDTDSLFLALDGALSVSTKPRPPKIELGELPGLGRRSVRASSVRQEARAASAGFAQALPPPAPSPSVAPPPAPPPSAAPMSVARAMAPQKERARARDEDESFGAVGGAAPASALSESADGAFAGGRVAHALASLRYADLVIADSFSAHRGKLRPIAEQTTEAINAAISHAHRVEGLGLGVSISDTTGHYAYRYVAEAPVTIPCDGVVHSVPLLSREADVRTLYVIVPRESLDAVRVASMMNPLNAPLLSGDVDVYLEDEFLVTTRLKTVPSGGRVSLGLGIEEAVKVARNTRFEEKAEGMLRGSLSLEHEVSVAIASRLATPVDVEVRERVPVKRPEQRELEVEILEHAPQWEPFDQHDTQRIEGGYRFLFTLAPGEEKKLGFKYRVRIDNKLELQGGNRREAR